MSRVLRAALEGALRDGADVCLLGEAPELSRVTAGLAAAWPDRVHALPAADATLAGVALGMALGGWRPVVELAGPDSLLAALPQLAAEAVGLPGPLVARVPWPAGQSATFLAAATGPSVVAAACEDDAAALLAEALRRPGLTILLEPARLAALPGAGEGLRALRRREGDAAAVLAWGEGVAAALEAAGELAEDGVEVEVLDLRALAPLDAEAAGEAVARSGRAVVVQPPPGLVEAVVDRAFWRLEAPIAPAEPEAARIAEAVWRVLED